MLSVVFLAAACNVRVDRPSGDDITVTITFVTGVAGVTVNPASITRNTGQAYGTLPAPTRDGFTFDGWFTAQTGGTQVTATTVITNMENHNLYARWTAQTEQPDPNPDIVGEWDLTGVLVAGTTDIGVIMPGQPINGMLLVDASGWASYNFMIMFGAPVDWEITPQGNLRFTSSWETNEFEMNINGNTLTLTHIGEGHIFTLVRK